MASSKGSTPASFPVVVHPYRSPTGTKCCAYELSPASGSNALVFIGGLGDGPHTVSYIRTIASKLESTAADLGYSVFEIRMTSSFNGYGHSRLSDDVKDVSALVSYLRGLGKEKIVLMGHSTGCQVSHSFQPIKWLYIHALV